MLKAFTGLMLTALTATFCPASLLSQEPADTIRFPSEDRLAAARLAHAARLCNPDLEPHAVAGAVAEGVAPLRLVARLALARVQQAQWDDALLEYQRLLQDADAALASVEAPPGATARTLRSVRALCHAGIAAMPPSIRDAYRRRVDGAAAVLLKDGLANRDESLLHKVVADYFASSSGAPASAALGDLAFERGDFDEAIYWWRPLDDSTHIRAKRILATIFQGDQGAARAELADFAARFPEASGRLAGREGRYVEILGGMLGETVSRTASADAQSWPTLTGAPTRSRMTRIHPNPQVWANGPTWRADLHDDDVSASQRRMSGRFPYFPLITSGHVVLGDTRRVRAFDMQTGDQTGIYDMLAEGLITDPGDGANFAALRRHGDVCAAGSRVYACLGAITSGEPGKSFLVCLQLPARGESRLRKLWHVTAGEGEQLAAPLVDERRVYVVVERNAGQLLRIFVDCHDADTGVRRWSQQVCETVDASEQVRACSMLTHAGPFIVYNSHTGGIVALGPYTGKPSWALHYAGGRDAVAARCFEPQPCVYQGQRVFAAPLDCRQLYSIDAATGLVQWERSDIAVRQLLGVAVGRVLLTTANGLRAIDVHDGLDHWKLPAVGRLTSAGRGFLSGGWVFWPTGDRDTPVRTVAVLDGSQEIFRPGLPVLAHDPTQLRQLQNGNFAYAAGILVIATEEELLAFVPSQPVR